MGLFHTLVGAKVGDASPFLAGIAVRVVFTLPLEPASGKKRFVIVC